MDMAELAELTGLPVRKLRYVSDHRVLPGLAGTATGHGVPRTFTDFEGFGIALAARLLDAGMTRKSVAACLTIAFRPGGPSEATPTPPLMRAYNTTGGRLEFGDAAYVRVHAPRRAGVGGGFDTGWVPVAAAGRACGGYAPEVLVAVELGGLVRAVRDRKTASSRT
jgi:hypothetical protein